MPRSICFALLFVVAAAKHVQFFRKDYTYNQEYDAFYKLHWNHVGDSWNSAFLKCDDEGATLFYPNQKDESTIVRKLMDAAQLSPNLTEVFVGLHDEFGIGEFMTVDGHSTPTPIGDFQHDPNSRSCVTMDVATGLYTVGPCTRQDNPVLFVCKKSDDETCPTIDRGYKYSEITKKCYKLNKKYKTWQEAMQTCYMEGGTLAVKDNEAQTRLFKDIIDYEVTSYYVGVRKLFDNGYFYSVKGQKYDDITTRNRNPYEYQNGEQNDLNCGVMYLESSNLQIFANGCNEKLQFICEMDVKT